MTKVAAYTARCILREFKREDIEGFHLLMSDPGGAPVSHDGPLARARTADLLGRVIQSYQVHGTGLYAVQLRYTGELLGACGFVRRQLPSAAEWEIRCQILPARRGQGYATEVARELRRFGVNRLKLKRFISIIEPDNEAAIRVARKIGMRFEGLVDLNRNTVRIYAFTSR